MKEYIRGIKRGMPICFGYIPVAFAFGIQAVKSGMDPLWATIMAFSNMASAGQVNGLSRILENATFISVIITTLVVNMRYTLMSFSLTQKIVHDMPWYKRCIMAFCICDEMFVFASMEEHNITFEFYAGLVTMPIVGWTLGTLLGGLATGLFSPMIQGCLGITLYSMFIAIIIPETRKSKKVAAVSTCAILLTCIFTYVPFINVLSKGGWGMIISAIVAAAMGATIKEVKRRKRLKLQSTMNPIKMEEA